MKTLVGILAVLVLVAMTPAAKACDRVFVQSGCGVSTFSAVQTVVVPESVSFFATSHPVAFVTNRVITTPSFFVASPVVVNPVVVQRQVVRQRVVQRPFVVRQRTVIR